MPSPHSASTEPTTIVESYAQSRNTLIQDEQERAAQAQQKLEAIERNHKIYIERINKLKELKQTCFVGYPKLLDRFDTPEAYQIVTKSEPFLELLDSLGTLGDFINNRQNPNSPIHSSLASLASRYFVSRKLN